MTTPEHGPGTPMSASTNSRMSDHAMEQLVGRLLQIGVLISAIVVMVGGALILTQHGNDPAVYGTFRGEPPYLTSLAGIVRGAVAFDSLAIAQLGLVLLIVTPVLRVAFTLVAFVLQRDRTYIVITTVILALLLYGLLLGRA
jgi:uncharacterized membrane protein